MFQRSRSPRIGELGVPKDLGVSYEMLSSCFSILVRINNRPYVSAKSSAVFVGSTRITSFLVLCSILTEGACQTFET